MQHLLKFYAKYTIILPVFCVITCSLIVFRNIMYHFGLEDTAISMVDPANVDLPSWVTTLVFVILAISILSEELYKKFLYIKLERSGEIILYRFWKEYRLRPSDVNSVTVERVFSRFGLPNEIIIIHTAREKFIVSQFYIRRYDKLKEELALRYDINLL
jgi:hypothetical protein